MMTPLRSLYDAALEDRADDFWWPFAVGFLAGCAAAAWALVLWKVLT